MQHETRKRELAFSESAHIQNLHIAIQFKCRRRVDPVNYRHEILF